MESCSLMDKPLPQPTREISPKANRSIHSRTCGVSCGSPLCRSYSSSWPRMQLWESQPQTQWFLQRKRPRPIGTWRLSLALLMDSVIHHFPKSKSSNHLPVSSSASLPSLYYSISFLSFITPSHHSTIYLLAFRPSGK